MTTTNTAKETKRINDFGAGRYSMFMGQVFEGCKSLFKLSLEVSAKIAKDAGSDIGSALAKSNDAKIGLGKVSKSGTVTVKDSASIKGVYVTNPIMVARSIQWINEATANGISYGNTKWSLIPSLEAYISDLQEELHPAQEIATVEVPE